MYIVQCRLWWRSFEISVIFFYVHEENRVQKKTIVPTRFFYASLQTIALCRLVCTTHFRFLKWETQNKNKKPNVHFYRFDRSLSRKHKCCLCLFKNLVLHFPFSSAVHAIPEPNCMCLECDGAAFDGLSHHIIFIFIFHLLLLIIICFFISCYSYDVSQAYSVTVRQTHNHFVELLSRPL